MTILETVKNNLDILSTETSYDAELLMLIKSELGILQQSGFKPDEVFTIDSNTDFSIFSVDDIVIGMLEAVFTASLKIDFDPTENTNLMRVRDERRKELRERLRYI